MMPTAKTSSALTPTEIAEFCKQLPGVREDFKWGSNQVFSVAGNKMFAIIHFLGDGLAFKVDSDLFLGYVDRPGIRPAPYLARAHWISMQCSAPAMQRDELFAAVTRSHQLVVRKLPKRLQPGLLLDE
ncbi:Predicted DNA-binding protein, MmcQ/YjbR family [Pseudomonas marincola]|nr:Predicted DNA-binding protein, MmcQ/YjbR family [Pseudomonas marincola]